MPGWLDLSGLDGGKLPTTINDTVSAAVCFSYGGNTCKHQIEEVFITHCGDFDLYALPHVPLCAMRYCSYTPCAAHEFNYPSCKGTYTKYVVCIFYFWKLYMFVRTLYLYI